MTALSNGFLLALLGPFFLLVLVYKWQRAPIKTSSHTPNAHGRDRRHK